MSERWWEKTCPACGEDRRIERRPSKDNTIRYCRACKFRWSTEWAEWVMIVLARGHNRKAAEAQEKES